MITCRAENVFGVQETEVELTVLGNFFYLFIFFYAEFVIQPSDVHANSYRHRDTREGEGGLMEPLPRVFDMLQYCSKRFCLQYEVYFIFGGAARDL